MLETHRTSSLFVVLNDIGFGQIRCYESPDQTLRFDRLIRCGLSGTNTQTVAIRSCHWRRRRTDRDGSSVNPSF